MLFLAGDPSGRGEFLRAAAESAGVREKVVWCGRLTDEDLAAAYREASLFVSASLYEGFGFPPLEAMACGCPVVSLAHGAVPEVVSGAALTVEEKDPVVFAAAIDRALGDGELRARLVEGGLARARELSWPRAAQTTLDLYRELCGRGNGAGA